MNDDLNGYRISRRCFSRNPGVHLIHTGIAWSHAGELHFGCEAVDQHIRLRSQVNQGVERRGLANGYIRRNRAKSGSVDRDEISRRDRPAWQAVHVWHSQYTGVGSHDSALTGTGSVEREYAGRGVLHG